MPEERARVLAPAKRICSFKEVVLGLKHSDAVENARIYLERERALKGQPCPLGTDHLALVRLAARSAQSSMAQALELLLSTNALPEVTGRLCGEIFEETLCQNRKGERVSLRAIERFLAEHYSSASTPHVGAGSHARPINGSRPKIAVIGSGPTGLCAAWALMQSGCRVTVFDSASCVGGTLSYAQAEFQLPHKALEAVMARFHARGIEFVTDFIFGRSATPGDLFEEGFGAVLIATGIGVAKTLEIPGENAGGVMTADDFLKAVNWRHEDPRLWLGPKVVVIGDEDSAFSCARMARRVGRDVTVVVRGPETHVKANSMFVRHGIEEGVKLKAFTNPVEILTGSNGCAAGVSCRYLDYRMDTKGRMVLVEDEAAAFTLEADTVITVAGWEANTLFLRDIPGLEFNADGSIRTKSEFAETSLKGVFAAGGVVEPGMSLTDAMLSGTRAAHEIDKYLNV
jgi:glutamate synthase (NADPH/NADH) small chain